MLEIITDELPEGFVGESYFFQLQAKSDEQADLRWSIESGGALPPDLELDPFTGIISGPAKRTDRVTFNFAVADLINKQFDEKNLMLVISKKEPVQLEIVTDSLPDVCMGCPYLVKLEGAGGKPPYRWNADDLPDDLQLSESGYFSGALKYSGGVASITVTLSDAENSCVSHVYFVKLG